MKNKIKIFSVVIAFTLLAAILINQFSDIITLAVENNRYLESVEIFTAPTKAEAKEKCKNAGFYVSDADLNEYNVGGAAVIGYTITDDPEKAVTDMSVLEMNTGYEEASYADIKETAMEKAGFVTSDLMKSVSEYRDNLENGSPKAIKAQKILNIYVIPEMNNIGLGDYLAGNKCTEDFLKKVICQANAGIIYTIFNAISSGVADFGENNWAQRIGEKTEVKEKLAAGNDNAFLDQSYKEYAYELCDQLQSFYEDYTKAKKYTDNNGMDALADGVEKVKDGDIADDTVEKLENGEQFDEKDGYFIYLEAYEILKAYQYDENTTLADYILNLGGSSYKTDADLRKIYPLVDALTQGQIGVFRVSGVTQMALALTDNSNTLDKTNEYIKEIYDLIEKAYDGRVKNLSIWESTDQTPYNTKIAKTSSEIVSTMSGMEFDNLTMEDGTEKLINKIITLTYVISAAIDAAGIITSLGAEVAVIAKTGFSAWLAGSSVSAWAICSNAIAFSSGAIFTSLLGILGCTVIILGYVAFAAVICIALYQVGKFIYDYFKEEDDTLDYSLGDIPMDVYDYRNQTHLHYKAVQLHGTGKAADVNAENGRRFAALYCTKDKKAGDPIKINPDGEEFVTISGNTVSPDGYEGVRYFSHGAVANLNSYAKNKDAKSLYLSYYKYAATPINEGEESVQPSVGTGEYLDSLYVSTQKTEAAAKDELKKAGYTPIDRNLTGFLGKKDGTYSFLGYKTTTLEKEAITDIRVVPAYVSTGSSFYFGNNAYIRAGRMDNYPSSVPSIYYSKSKDAGTAIYADLQVTSSRSNAKAGYEPVNLFCGGDAYNLNATGDSEYDQLGLTYSNWKNSTNTFIYFHPSVSYTSGQEYVGGLTFFTGKNTSANSGDEIKDYAESNGFKVFDGNFTDDYSIVFDIVRHIGKGRTTSEKTVDDIVTYLAYSTTYNPYRAIYGVKSYTAMTPDITSLNEMMLTNATENSKESYAACNVFFQFGNDIEESDEELRGFTRGILISNAWNGINEQSGQTILPNIAEYPQQETEDFETCGWKTSAPRLKNLYVCGYVPGKAPLKADEIRLTSNLKKEQDYNNAGLYSVQDMKTPNREKAHNIGISAKNPMYLFIRKDKPHEGKYISSISVASWDLKSYIGDEKIYNDLEDDEKEMYESMKDDLCMPMLLQSCGDEVILRNLAVGYGASKQASLENEDRQAAYIGVTRTDNSAEAIHSIIKYRYKLKDHSDAELKIRVGGTEYTRVGTEPIHDEQFGYYFLYVSKSGTAPGEPLTSISFNDIPLVKDCATVLTAMMETDVTEYSKGKEVTKSRAELKGYKNETNYIHCAYETQRTYICDIFIGTGDTQKDAMLDLINMGCNMFLPIDMNEDTAGKYIYIGYDRSDSVDYAVRDIICTVGQKAEQTIEKDGAVYQRARDKYIMNYDDSKAVSFNEGTNGYSIYLYYSYDTDNAPVMKLAASERDYVPDNQGKFIWETIMTDNSMFCNFNDGVFASKDGHSVDNRIYLYLNRNDNSIKSGIKLPKGSSADKMEYGELKMASA